MIKRICLTCVVLFFAVAVMRAGADPMQDSANWAGSWEGDVLPYDGGAGQFDPYWFDGTPHTDYEINNTGFNPTHDIMTIVASAGALWYQADTMVSFNFATGASVEWRIKGHYGTANSGQVFFNVGDASHNVRFTVTYPDASPTGNINVGGEDLPFGLRWDATPNEHHTFRVTVLGSVVKLYIDGNPVQSLTGVTTAGHILPQNNLSWGDKLMQFEFDYLRWTTAGAFEPVSIALNPPSKYSTDWEGSYEGDVLPYDGGAGWWEPLWFTTPGDSNDTAFEISYTTIIDMPYETELGLDNKALNVPNPGALWYKAPNPVWFDFAVGATVEMRLKSHYGTANSGQNYFNFGDGTDAVRCTFTYPEASPWGMIRVNEAEYPFDMHNNQLSGGNTFHTFRVTALGSVVKLYIDGNSEPTITTVTDTRLLEQPANNLTWGDKLMRTDFDYLRWTRGGAFAQPSECEVIWHGYVGGVEQDLNRDCNVDVLDLSILVEAWLSCNDPAGCP